MDLSSRGTSAHNTEEDELDRMALEEIMKETKRGRERAQSMGPMGWVKCPLQPTNKRFFQSVIMATMANPRHNNKKTKANDDFKRCCESSSNTASILDPGECSLSQDRTQTLSSRTKSPERNTSKHDSTLTRKKSKRNVYSSEDKKDKKQESTTETSSANQLTDTCISDQHKQSRKHKHKSKHKHKKKKKRKS